MSAVDLKAVVKACFDLKDFKCRKNDQSVLSTATVKSPIQTARPMGDLENSRDSQHFRMNDKQVKADGHKFSYPVHRKRPRFLSQTRSADSYYNNKKRRKGEKIILPTKFLLGGNINDPLNLNSLCDEEVNRALNERTPQSSPVPTPAHRRDVTVVMPRNKADPLNLNEPDMENEPLTPAKMNAKRKKRHKGRKKSDGTCSGDMLAIPITPVISKESEKKKFLAEALKIEIDEESIPMSATIFEAPRHKSAVAPSSLSVTAIALSLLSSTTGMVFNSEPSENHKIKPEDKIVSPVIPQMSKSRKRRQASVSEGRSVDPGLMSSKNFNRSESCPGDMGKPVFIRKNRRRQSHRGGKGGNSANSKSSRFMYGNYNRYYGYRNPDESDHRTNCFKQEWFESKKVLDIGCNVGHLTLFVACEFKPQLIVGLDIDHKLISAARNNIRHYMNKDDQNKFPTSCKLSYGPLAAPVHQESKQGVFPHNVTFTQGNYVPESDDLLDLQKPDYDLILAMSLTKWIHLNWGDAGLKRSFHRMYRQLRPGGKLILEPQAWGSYKKRKWISDNIRQNFQKINLKPDNFAEYLIDEVGFSRYEVIDVPFNRAKGFQRPILLFYKDRPSSTTSYSPDTVTATESATAAHSSVSATTTTTLSTTTTLGTDVPSTAAERAGGKLATARQQPPPSSLGQAIEGQQRLQEQQNGEQQQAVVLEQGPTGVPTPGPSSSNKTDSLPTLDSAVTSTTGDGAWQGGSSGNNTDGAAGQLSSAPPPSPSLLSSTSASSSSSHSSAALTPSSSTIITTTTSTTATSSSTETTVAPTSEVEGSGGQPT